MRLILLFLFLLATPLIASIDETFSELIEISKKNLSEQQILYSCIVDFQKKREAFIEDPDDAKLATQLVKSAVKMEKEIEKSHFQYLFPPDFMTEVHFFAKIGKKK